MRWHVYVQQNRDQYRIGSARINFQIDRTGKQKNIHVISNTSDREFLTMCIRCIKEPKLPVPPRNFFKTAKDQVLDIPFTFTLTPT